MDLVRALGLAGIRCAVVAPSGGRIRRSRFVDHIVEFTDSGEGPGALLEPLLRFARGQAARPVLYYVDDRGLEFVSRFRTQLAEDFCFVVPEAGLIDDLVDKGRFRDLAERLRLPVPPSRLLSSGAHPPDPGLRFPLVVKPRTRHNESWEPLGAGAKALLVQTADDLLRVSTKLMQSGVEGALVQELVPGPETRIESYHAYVDTDGAIAGEFTGRKIRTWPAMFGHSTALEITRQDDVAKLGRQILDRVGLRGVAKLDFKRGSDGTLYLLEINPRFTLWHHPGARAGVNLAALVYGDLVGAARKPAVAARAGVRWCQPRLDAVAARDVGISRFRWLWWALGCEANSAGSWDDPMPLVYWTLQRLLRRRKAVPIAGGALRRPVPHTRSMGAHDERAVQAAGGVIARRTRRGEVEVLLVHRPHREDWSFPKGKLEAGESHERCALREVEEETGLRCALGAELPSCSYRNGEGRPKVVRYWIMDPGDGRAGPRNEVDEVRWVALAEAAALLTYPRDREILKAFAAAAG